MPITLLLGLASVGHATPPTPYATELAIVDGICIAAFSGGVAVATSDHEYAPVLLGVLGASGAVAVYLTGGPTTRDRPGRAWASVGLRVGFAIAGGAIGLHLRGCSDDTDACDRRETVGGYGGIAAGWLAASAIDVLVLARVDATPVVTPTTGGAVVGVAMRW